ncbi:substrate-binding domain-containing protein [Paraflavisolibacter sp. H34]|uniref:LacI family DNA-binding transcriptional regulator n=1 Tax=Huijunlia imazamoxiresistens TaxID=3127457 RepID=UPI0030159023
MKKISISEIAKMAGVAPSTVSLVVSGKARERRISKELEAKVMEVVEKVGYKPNQLAVSFRTGKSMTIGLLVENISGNFFGSLAKVLQEAMERFGYQVIYCSTDNDPEKGRALIDMLSQRLLDGFLVTPTVGMKDDITALAAQGKPVVLLDAYFPDLDVPYVLTDNFSAITEGMEHLLHKGYQNIAFVTIDLPLNHMLDRLQAYRAALEQQGLPVQEENILKVKHNCTKPEGAQIIADFLKSRPGLDAVFFDTDYLGVMGLGSMKKLGLKIPADLAVICFDDHDVFSNYTPEVTAIRQDVDKIGQTAVKILMGELGAGPKVKKNQVKVKAQLIERASV